MTKKKKELENKTEQKKNTSDCLQHIEYIQSDVVIKKTNPSAIPDIIMMMYILENIHCRNGKKK